MPTNPTTSENAPRAAKPAARKRAPKKVAPVPVKVKRAPKTREAAIAQIADAYALAKNPASYGATVTAPQVAYYEAALKALRKGKTNAQFLGFKTNEAALRALRPVAQGTTSSSSLPAPCKDAFGKLYARLNILHTKDGRVNKTWPRKRAIVLVALLSEKPKRNPAQRKPKPVATPESVAPPAAA